MTRLLTLLVISCGLMFGQFTTLPAAAGGGGGSGTPGGSSGQVQINSSGAFGGRNLPEFSDDGTNLNHNPAYICGKDDDCQWNGKQYYPASSTQSITAVGNAILANAKAVAVSPTSSLTLTSAPTIADGTNGQELSICNVNTSNTLTLQDQDTLASSNLQLASTTLAIAPKACYNFRFDSTVGDWLQIGASGGSSSTTAIILANAAGSSTSSNTNPTTLVTKALTGLAVGGKLEIEFLMTHEINPGPTLAIVPRTNVTFGGTQLFTTIQWSAATDRGMWFHIEIDLTGTTEQYLGGHSRRQTTTPAGADGGFVFASTAPLAIDISSGSATVTIQGWLATDGTATGETVTVRNYTIKYIPPV